MLLTDISIHVIFTMIKSFADRFTQDIFDGTDSRFSRQISPFLREKAQRLLDQINAAPSLEVLSVSPGNRLKKLSGDLGGFWSIRINVQWRIIFRWLNGDAYEVRIVDYH